MALFSIWENVDFIFSTLCNNTVALCVLNVLLVISYWFLTIPRGIPPGPAGLPLVGYIPFVKRKAQDTFTEIAKKYGPVFSIYLGSRLTVVLNDFESTKEAFIKQGDIFSGRPNDFSFSAVPHDKYIIVTNDGALWKDHRRFALTVLRDCGVGKLSIEPGIMEEIHHFISEVKSFGGKATDFSEILGLSICNNICFLTLRRTFNYDDPWLIKTKRTTDQILRQGSPLALFNFFPWFSKIPGTVKLLNQENLIYETQKLDESIRIIIEEMKKRHTNGQWDSYAAAYVTERKKRDEKQITDDVFADDGLIQNTRSLVVAGTETTATTLMWIVKYLIHYPEVQEKVQKEIDEVIGSERTPSFYDRQRTPYTEATIYEIQRTATLVPINIPHRNIKDCTIRGYKIPKDSYILANLWNIHHDPKLWKDPEVFRPERFLSPNGEAIKPEYLIPFSMGKRECLGENLARMEIYLYTTALLQKFTFKEAEGIKDNLEGSDSGVTYVPKDFCPRAILRSVN